MPILEGISPIIDVDQVLKAQGADPEIIRKRKPQLVKIAQNALEQGYPYLDFKVLFREIDVLSLKHERLKLEDQHELKGKLIAEHLGPAAKVILILCTIGSRLEDYSLNTIKSDPVTGLALEGVGSAAVEALANAACNYFEEKAHEENLGSTIPLSPGMIGWSVEEGQPQIFKLLDTNEIGVSLTTSYLMLPRKTLSMVIGIGADIKAGGKTCDYCTMNETCAYQHQYTSSH
ncbi:MAG: hypothetical protein H8E29_04125 [Anaerolineales bacterium]|uniref:AdoMet activation domain-containing protein n=1 Tax=Candidatus Desulfolinea nitratireducens TaxID=2841698 RepID=A0A8J6NGN0_9CHLR|nr:hypothetical protein [Candidatus Desulfolinea nitratireducens]